MDRITKRKQLVKEIMQEVYDYFPEVDAVRTELICDDTAGHYEIMQVGWLNRRRIHGIVVHVDVTEDRIYVEHNGTDIDVVEMIQKEGVPDSEIVLGWHPPHLREYTEFALA